VDLCEELLVEQRCELFRGVFNVLDDLGRRSGVFRAKHAGSTHFLVDLLRCHTVLSQVIKKDIDFDSVSLKAFVNVSGLDQVSKIRKSIQVLGTE